MGRFLQTDPIGYADSMNLYQGLGQNPGNYRDPFGKEYFVFNTSVTPATVSIWNNRADYLSGVDALYSNLQIDSLTGTYANMIQNNNLLTYSQTETRRVEFVDRVGGWANPYPGSTDTAAGTGYNATAKVFASYGAGQIEYKEFDARTIPSNPDAHSKIGNGKYVGIWWEHNNSYPAIQLRAYKENTNIQIWGENTAHPEQVAGTLYTLNGSGPWTIGYMNHINVHKSFFNPIDGTGHYTNASGTHYSSMGCINIRNSEWNTFYSVLNINEEAYGESGTQVVHVIVNTTANNAE